MQSLILDYQNVTFGRSAMVKADCLEWLSRVPENSLHAIVTDPPYGHREYQSKELEKLHNGNKGGIWRIPPSFDGSVRAPLPRFTALDDKDRREMVDFFTHWSQLCLRALRPGAHLFVASNAFIVPLMLRALVDGGLQFRTQIIRQVRTLRGGDRPKNFEQEFSEVSSLPKGAYEPWVLFRKPLPAKMTVGEALRTFETGGLRRLPNDRPFDDLVISERTPAAERKLADHPSLKPQSLMRLFCYVALPLGKGVIADPFAGSGSTVAAAESLGLRAIGVERYDAYFELAKTAIPLLSKTPTKVDDLLGCRPQQKLAL